MSCNRRFRLAPRYSARRRPSPTGRLDSEPVEKRLILKGRRRVALFVLCTINGHKQLPILDRLPILHKNLGDTPGYKALDLVDYVERLDGADKLACLNAVTDCDHGTSFGFAP